MRRKINTKKKPRIDIVVKDNVKIVIVNIVHLIIKVKERKHGKKRHGRY